ncbi:MAG: TetR/AcrR family transcriptional regulator [Chloroflexota bacterium]|nr:TetR/AcrR family transcriptional regulator [Chloroflexota bacterium]
MSKIEKNAARERVLDVAEALFSEHGYTTVTLRDIAARLDMKAASLYYHAPHGKEELFVAVIERMMRRHQEALHRLIAEQGDDWQAQLVAITHWLLSQPPLDAARMMRTDLHALGKANADQITMSMYWVMQPIEAVFSAAQDQVGRSVVHPGVLAGTLLAIINGMNLSPLGSDPARKTAAADGVLSLLIKGLLAG